MAAMIEDLMAEMVAIATKVDKIYDDMVKGPKEGDTKKTPFGELKFQNGKWVAVPSASASSVPPQAAISNGIDNPPGVYQTAIVSLVAFIDLPGLGRRWCAYWPASNTTAIAEIRPYSAKEFARASTCNTVLPAGLFSYGPPVDLPKDAVVIKITRNPAKAIPEGCQIGADGYSLVDKT